MTDDGARCDGTDRDDTEERSESEHDWATVKPSTAVVERIASLEGTGPVAMATDGGPTLTDSVDPDALDRLVGDARGTDVTLSFTVDRYRVQVDSSGLVVARRERDASEPTES